jgi:hypothetical protein
MPKTSAVIPRRVVGIVATLAVAALVIAGLFAAGSPGTARKFRIDRDRIERLSNLHSSLAAFGRENGSLPETLRGLEPDTPDAEFSESFDPRKDPETGEFFEYRKISDREYRVCATFLTSSSDRRDESYYGPEGELSHKPGRNCYERRLSSQDLQSDFYPKPQEPRIIPPVSETTRSPSPDVRTPSPTTPSPTPTP